MTPATSPTEILREVFGHGTLRGGQRQAMESAFAGQDTVVLLPTGGGKSLCYQLPALVARRAGKGPTLVISPLIALMRDQVDSLRAAGVAVKAVNSHEDHLDNRAALAEFITGKLDLLYVSPERAALEGFRSFLSRANVSYIAIDEAHCMSQWGHDFRREYLRLHELRTFTDATIIALTATATPTVIDEICSRLELKAPMVVRGSFARPNLSFNVLPLATDAQRIEHLVDRLTEHGMRSPGAGRSIVYCATRKKVEAVHAALKSRSFPVGYYHAGRSELARSRAQAAYDTGKRPILVATNAFGMGVDSPNVRLLVHFQTPGSLEAYYQEAGRAGRDGLPAECNLYFGISDLVTQRFMNQKATGDARSGNRRASLLDTMESYARTSECRQVVMCRYFAGPEEAEDIGSCGVCDTCATPDAVVEAWEAFEASRPAAKKQQPAEALDDGELNQIVQAVDNLKRPVGKLLLAKALRGSRDKRVTKRGLTRLPEHGLLKHHSEVSLVAAIEDLLRSRRIERRGQKYPTVWPTGKPVRASTKGSQKTSSGTGRGAPKRASSLTHALDAYRKRAARKLKWKPYMVFQRKVIAAIDDIRPQDTWSLSQVHGLGPAKIERFGDDIIAMVQEYDR